MDVEQRKNALTLGLRATSYLRDQLYRLITDQPVSMLPEDITTEGGHAVLITDFGGKRFRVTVEFVEEGED